MGYNLDFLGEFSVEPALMPDHKQYLKAFSETRRIGRKQEAVALLPDPDRENAGLPFGIEGGYYVGGDNSGDDVMNKNTPPVGQPGLWCQWEPDDTGTKIEWDGAEKFSCYLEWMDYIVQHFLKPWGYTVNGEVEYQGEESDDFGKVVVVDNIVKHQLGSKMFVDKEEIITADGGGPLSNGEKKTMASLTYACAQGMSDGKITNDKAPAGTVAGILKEDLWAALKLDELFFHQPATQLEIKESVSPIADGLNKLYGWSKGRCRLIVKVAFYTELPYSDFNLNECVVFCELKKIHAKVTGDEGLFFPEIDPTTMCADGTKNPCLYYLTTAIWLNLTALTEANSFTLMEERNMVATCISNYFPGVHAGRARQIMNFLLLDIENGWDTNSKEELEVHDYLKMVLKHVKKTLVPGALTAGFTEVHIKMVAEKKSSSFVEQATYAQKTLEAMGMKATAKLKKKSDFIKFHKQWLINKYVMLPDVAENFLEAVVNDSWDLNEIADETEKALYADLCLTWGTVKDKNQDVETEKIKKMTKQAMKIVKDMKGPLSMADFQMLDGQWTFMPVEEILPCKAVIAQMNTSRLTVFTIAEAAGCTPEQAEAVLLELDQDWDKDGMKSLAETLMGPEDEDD